MQFGRLGTAIRQGTAMREVNLGGVGYNTKVSSVDRPVTNHGLSGMGAGSVGPGRQIYDRNYYNNLLRNKNNEIATEINKMKQEVEDINKDNATYLTLERKYEALIKDVRKFEGDLADYNLALDKHRSDTKPEDIEALYMHIKNQNDKQRAHLDTLFAEKRDMENELNSYEQQINDINFANEARLNDLDPEQRNEYEKLKQENNQLQHEIGLQRQELEDVTQRLHAAENRLKQDSFKQRAQHLREEKAQLLKRKEDLELQSNELNLPFPEARERFMNRIKQDNAEIKQQEKEVSDLRKMIDTYTRNIKEIESDLRDKPKDGSNDDNQKYEILYKKEKEINDFTEKYETEKQKLQSYMTNTQETITALLEHMQKNLSRQNKLPSANRVEEMRKDLNFKQRQLNEAESTAASLQVEVEARKMDLEKITNLEGRMDKEMEVYAENINRMEDEMANKFTRIEELQASHESEKQRLKSIRTQVNSYRTGIAKQSTYHAMKHDTRRNMILQNEIYNRLNEVEKRLIGNESTIYGIQQYIEAKGAESNYQEQMQQSIILSTQINDEIIRRSLAP